jgi:hypothetical protein
MTVTTPEQSQVAAASLGIYLLVWGFKATSPVLSRAR